jgi:hypothetical protein
VAVASEEPNLSTNGDDFIIFAPGTVYVNGKDVVEYLGKVEDLATQFALLLQQIKDLKVDGRLNFKHSPFIPIPQMENIVLQDFKETAEAKFAQLEVFGSRNFSMCSFDFLPEQGCRAGSPYRQSRRGLGGPEGLSVDI